MAKTVTAPEFDSAPLLSFRCALVKGHIVQRLPSDVVLESSTQISDVQTTKLGSARVELCRAQIQRSAPKRAPVKKARVIDLEKVSRPHAEGVPHEHRATSPDRLVVTHFNTVKLKQRVGQGEDCASVFCGRTACEV